MLNQLIEREQTSAGSQRIRKSTTGQSRIKWSVFVGVCLVIPGVGSQSASNAQLLSAPTYSCKFTSKKPPLDGSLSGPWSNAASTSTFIDITGNGPTPRYTTTAMMLWDNQYLYIGARLQDPDVWANMKTRNSPLYLENNFEVFLDPESDGLNYYEFEINALGTTWQLSLDKPYNQVGHATSPNEISGLISKVRVKGTLNRPGDVDRGWAVELAIPWAGVSRFSSKQGAPNNGDSVRVQFARSQWGLTIDGNGNYAKTSQSDAWVWASMNGQSTVHDPSSWGMVRFVGRPTPSLKGYRYVDCYQDSNEKRLLRNKLSGKGGMSLELCASLATLAGYTIFGVEYSSECWADIKFGNNHAVSSKSCNMSCDGKTSQICGGNGALSVFAKN